MGSSSYQYEDLEAKGYLKIHLPKKVHNEIFPKRKIKWHNRYEYYMNEKEVILQRFTSVWAKIYIVLMFPVGVFLCGYPQYKKEMVEELFQKKYGSFSSERTLNRADKPDSSYQKVKAYVDGQA